MKIESFPEFSYSIEISAKIFKFSRKNENKFPRLSPRRCLETIFVNK